VEEGKGEGKGGERGRKMGGKGERGEGEGGTAFMAIHTVSLCAPLNEQQYPGIALTGHVVFEAQWGKCGETGESL